MNVTMAGIDYCLAGIDVRERFSFTKSSIGIAYESVLSDENILGAVILSTCNRTEIYLSCRAGFEINPFEVLCTAAGADFSPYDGLYRARSGRAVIRHLCGLACGIKSQIFGEDQIISQVRGAIELSRELGAADSVLEVLFRNAVSAAKKVKTTVRLCSREASVVDRAVEVLDRENCRERENTQVLIIGNGEIGRLAAAKLLEGGYRVTMTLRHYRHGENIIPTGANVVDYAERYKKMADCDAVISATLSPHHTVEAAQLRRISNCPKLFIDLAVPRDIEPSIAAEYGVKLYDIDTLAPGAVSRKQARQRAEIEGIIEKYACEYEHWCAYTNLQSARNCVQKV